MVGPHRSTVSGIGHNVFDQYFYLLYGMGNQSMQAVGLCILLLVAAVATVAVLPGTALADVDQDFVDEINDGAIAEVNAHLEETVNPGLEHVEGIDTVDPVEAETEAEAESEADRLEAEAERIQEEMFDRVPREMNEQAGRQVVSPDAIETPDDARDEAQDFYDTYSAIRPDSAEEGKEALMNAADFVEETNEKFDEAAASLRGDRHGVVEGTVVDEDGEVVADATVSIDEEDHPDVAVGDDGSFELELVEGEWTIVVEADGYERANESVDVDPADTASVEVTLTADEDDSSYRAVAEELPGFGVTAALVAGLLAAALVTRR